MPIYGHQTSSYWRWREPHQKRKVAGNCPLLALVALLLAPFAFETLCCCLCNTVSTCYHSYITVTSGKNLYCLRASVNKMCFPVHFCLLRHSNPECTKRYFHSPCLSLCLYSPGNYSFKNKTRLLYLFVLFVASQLCSVPPGVCRRIRLWDMPWRISWKYSLKTNQY